MQPRSSLEHFKPFQWRALIACKRSLGLLHPRRYILKRPFGLDSAHFQLDDLVDEGFRNLKKVWHAISGMRKRGKV